MNIIRKIVLLGIAIVAVRTVDPAAACTMQGNMTSHNTMGFTVYPQVLWTTTGPSGRKLGAYNGHFEASLEACIGNCILDGECAGATYRPHSRPDTCLKFSRTDYETGERRRSFVAHKGIEQHNSTIVRRKTGRLCND